MRENGKEVDFSNLGRIVWRENEPLLHFRGICNLSNARNVHMSLLVRFYTFKLSLPLITFRTEN